jgi:hypothetical protein
MRRTTRLKSGRVVLCAALSIIFIAPPASAVFDSSSDSRSNSLATSWFDVAFIGSDGQMTTNMVVNAADSYPGMTPVEIPIVIWNNSRVPRAASLYAELSPSVNGSDISDLLTLDVFASSGMKIFSGRPSQLHAVVNNIAPNASTTLRFRLSWIAVEGAALNARGNASFTVRMRGLAAGVVPAPVNVTFSDTFTSSKNWPINQKNYSSTSGGKWRLIVGSFLVGDRATVQDGATGRSLVLADTGSSQQSVAATIGWGTKMAAGLAVAGDPTVGGSNDALAVIVYQSRVDLVRLSSASTTVITTRPTSMVVTSPFRLVVQKSGGGVRAWIGDRNVLDYTLSGQLTQTFAGRTGVGLAALADPAAWMDDMAAGGLS